MCLLKWTSRRAFTCGIKRRTKSVFIFLFFILLRSTLVPYLFPFPTGLTKTSVHQDWEPQDSRVIRLQFILQIPSPQHPRGSSMLKSKRIQTSFSHLANDRHWLPGVNKLFGRTWWGISPHSWKFRTWIHLRSCRAKIQTLDLETLLILSLWLVSGEIEA